MSQSTNIQLNPADYFFFSHDQMMRRRREGGNIAFMIMDLDGAIDATRMKSALQRVFEKHPVLASRIGMSVVWGRPFWKISTDPADIATATSRAYRYDDLRNYENADIDLEKLCQTRYGADWDLQRGPQLHLEHYDLPKNKTRVCIRWPHLFMDAEGAMWFLAELASIEKGEDLKAIDGLHSDNRLNDPLSGIGLPEKLTLFRKSFAAQRQHGGQKIRTLFDGEQPRFTDYRYVHRQWSGDNIEKLKSLAKKTTPPGPALYARYLATCTIRALDRLFSERNVDTDVYLITMPQSVSNVDANAASHTRPLQGNYLVSPTLRGPRALAQNKAALAAEISKQLFDYHEQKTPLKQWAMFWAANWSRSWFYQLLMRLPLGLEALASGFSYYGEIRYPIREMCGAKVENLWGAGPLPTPPAWNPVFSRFGDHLNLSLTYTRPVVDDELAERYVDYIENEIFEENG